MDVETRQKERDSGALEQDPGLSVPGEEKSSQPPLSDAGVSKPDTKSDGDPVQQPAVENNPQDGAAPEAAQSGRFSLMRPVREFVSQLLFSSLTRRILILNLMALFLLMSAILYLNQFQKSLIEARIESLVTQGRIIASAVSASAVVETGDITIDPDKIFLLKPGESIKPRLESLDSFEFPIDPTKIAPVLRSLIEPTSTRARIYDPDGSLMLDSSNLYAGGQVQRFPLPDLTNPGEEIGMTERLGDFLNRLLQRNDLPVYKEYKGSGLEYGEVVSALTGQIRPVVRMTTDGKQIVSVAVPIQRFRAVLGVLLLSTEAGDIDRKLAEERLIILRIFLVAGIVMVLLSVLLARTIAKPLGQLSEAANRVRRGVKSRIKIPDFSYRKDEVGTLSGSLTEMTDSLYARIDAIESFAADVSHELKNPLTSLRSAVETLPLVKNEASQKRLLEVIQHDVQRLDRLITDISDASRLDAELGRADADRVDVRALIEGVIKTTAELSKRQRPVDISLVVANTASARRGFFVSGHESRLGQVINNLLDNARSFVPSENGLVRVSLIRNPKTIVITVEDNGPGIDKDNLERIFTRFYTDRPGAESFGQNSGLGLSISKQIIEAHGGRIRAANRSGPETGAIFTITLPAEK